MGIETIWELHTLTVMKGLCCFQYWIVSSMRIQKRKRWKILSVMYSEIVMSDRHCNRQAADEPGNVRLR